MTTLKDIAKATGVSISTVSRALNNSSSISETTRILVQEMARKMDYWPNKSESAPSTSQKNVIGVIVHYIALPFFSTLVSGIQDTASMKDYSIMLFSTERDAISEKKVIDTILARDDIAGVIIAPCETEEIDCQPLYDALIPVVYAGYRPSESFPSMWAVTPDYFLGGKMATEYLISCGMESVALFTGPVETESAKERIGGYLDGIKDTALTPSIFSGPLTYHAAYQKGLEMFGTPGTPKVDAVISGADMQAIGIIHALEKCGLKVPDDVSIISSEDTYLTDLSSPKLTSISVSIYSMGSKSVLSLVDQIDGSLSAVKVELIKPNLIERKSCRDKNIRKGE